MYFLLSLIYVICGWVAVVECKVDADNTFAQEEDELVVYPFDVKLHTMSPTYLLLSFKIRLHNETLFFDLASSSNDSYCEMNGYLVYSNYIKSTQLSVCDGIAGFVDLGDSKFLNFLPVLEDNIIISISNLSKTEHIIQVTDSVALGMVVDKRETNRVRRGWGTATLEMMNESGKYVRLYYMLSGQRRYHTRMRINEKVAIVSYVGTTWYAYDRNETAMLFNGNFQFFIHPTYRNKKIHINIHAKTRITNAMRLKNLPEMRERYMEVVVICDAPFINYYGGTEKTEKYVKALMVAVNRIYRHKSLGISLHIVLKRVIFEKNWRRLRIPKNNPKPALRMACKYAFDWKKQYREKFDFAVVLTRIRFGVSGYAPVYRMCVEYKSCTLVSDSGFNSAFIIAHEMAHSVGVLHDGDNNRCRHSASSGSIMSPTIYSTFYRYHWSNCSKITMRENLRYFNCLYDKPTYYEFNSLELPGSTFDLDQQCRFRMGKGHTACLGRREDRQYCRFMFCRRPKQSRRGRITCTYWSIAPPDGTICATGKWCVAGKCLPKGLLSPAPIDGAWSRWAKWGRCDGTCGKGVQFRKRECNNPKPQFKGKKCSGRWQEWRVCNKEPCTVNKVFEDQRLEQCYQNGRGWDWLPNTNILQSMNDINLNCTFENGSCNWHMGSEKSSYTFGKGKTPTQGTGPYHDHTFQNQFGTYIFLEASYPRRRKDKVEITSSFLFVHKSCLKFYYFMMGSAIDTLVVYVEYGDNKRKDLWRKKGDQGDAWLRAEVTLEEEKEFKIVIQSIVGNNYLGDIALDDISATDGACKTTVSDCWSVISGGCVVKHNIVNYSEKSITECKSLCLQDAKCLAFEYGVDHGGKGTKYNPGFCQLQDSSNSTSCDGVKHNLDLYVKNACPTHARTNPCKITCVHAEKKVIKYGYAIGDGHKCYDGKEDVCVTGNCWRVGCDSKRESRLRYDKCGNCGGDGSTCNMVNVVLNAIPEKPQDTIITLPPGSTNVRIEKKGKHRGFIAVRFRRNTYYYYEAPPFYPWYYFQMAGATFRYYIMKDKTQVIYADGPTTEPTQVQLIFRGRNFQNPNANSVKINMTYYVRKQPTDHIYLWQLEEDVENCNVVCGGGNYSLTSNCVDMSTQQVVERAKCSPAYVSPVAVTKPCNTQLCKLSYEYKPGPWGSCTSCNKVGQRVRNVTCVSAKEGSSPQTVDDSNCANVVKPILKKNCYLYCPYARRKCVERQRKCPMMKVKGYCRYRSVQLLCCKTCNTNGNTNVDIENRTGSYEIVI